MAASIVAPRGTLTALPPVTAFVTAMERWFSTLALGRLADSATGFALTLAFALVVLASCLIKENRRLAATTLSFALLLLAAASFKSGDATGFLELHWSDRYFFLPKLFVIWILIGAVWYRPRDLAIPAAVALIVAINPLNRAPYEPFRKPPLEDMQWKKQAAAIDRNEPATIYINPYPWAVVVPPSRRR